MNTVESNSVVKARDTLLAKMTEHANFGARDSEGWQAVDAVEYAASHGERFPLAGRNPFQLYESVPGWRNASAGLVIAAHTYWRVMVRENLGI